LLQLNILFTKITLHQNNDSPVIHHSHITATSRVLERTGFHQSEVIHLSERSVLYQSKNCVFNFTAKRYSLHKCGETIVR